MEKLLVNMFAFGESFHATQTVEMGLSTSKATGWYPEPLNPLANVPTRKHDIIGYVNHICIHFCHISGIHVGKL